MRAATSRSRAHPSRWALLVAAGLIVATLPSAARARPGRFAIVVGSDVGDPSEVQLRFAEADARRMAEALRAVGGFFPENVTVLTAGSGEDVRRALIGLNARLRQIPGALLLVYYSGHADAEALHLGGTRLPFSELRDLTAGSPAEARVLVVDSCRSGALTRVKGGHPVPNFEIHADPPSPTQGLAILTSSAAGEDAQESDQLGASIFSHYLFSALLGAADVDHDGRVTIDEAFGYASERTLTATAFTRPGPQHPTYRLELGGRNDLILSEPGRDARGRGKLAFDAPGTFMVQSGGPDGPMVAEVTADRPGGQLALEPGRYFVSERNRDFVRQGSAVVVANGMTTIGPEQMRRVDYARVVRKGTAQPSRALSAFASGGVRSELADLGTAFWSSLGARLDLPTISLELRIGSGGSQHSNSRLSIDSYEVDTSLAGLHVFDFDRLSIGLGLEVGAAWFAQRFSDPSAASRNVMAALVAPVAELEVPLGRRAYARVDAGFVTYFLPAGGSAGTSHLVSYRATAGAGMYFGP